MSKPDDRRKRNPSERTTGEMAFVPLPVDPESARRRDAGAPSPASRDIVELTSPIGHRLRVPPAEPAAPGAKPAPAKPER